MPTLLDVGSFNFYCNSVPDVYKYMLTSKKAIEIILSILSDKIKRNAKGFDKIYLLDGRTGSGKSTLMITSIYNKLCKNIDKSILCVEPRVVLAKSNAEDILRYNDDLEYGNNVGVITGDTKTKTKGSAVIYCTSAILSSSIQKCIETGSLKTLSKYNIIVIDEVHTMGAPEVYMLMLIKQLFNMFIDKVEYDMLPMFIFTSATIDIPLICKYYFNDDDIAKVLNDPLMIGIVKGAMNFPVDERFLTNEHVDLTTSIASLLDECIKSTTFINVNKRIIPCRDMLIFCPTKKIITDIMNKLYTHLHQHNHIVFMLANGTTMATLEEWRKRNNNKQRILLIPFASSIKHCGNTILNEPFENNPEVNANEVKIIVSTPVIESGKTLSTLHVCIDLGMQLKPIYDAFKYISGNKQIKYSKLPADKFSITQRLGRIGREASGIFLHFYSNKTFALTDKFYVSDFSNSLFVSNYVLSIAQHNKLNDIVNLNLFINKCNIATLINTYTDLFKALVFTLDGSYVGSGNIDIDWVIYAKYMYMIMRYPLLTSLMIASFNRRCLDNSHNVLLDTISQFDTKFDLDMYPEDRYTYIVEAHNLYNIIITEPYNAHKGFPLRQEDLVI